MSSLFYGAISFNEDLSNWDVSHVTDMSYMFSDATSFNGNVSAWNTSSVTSMFAMFYRAFSFNQDLCLWRDAFPYYSSAQYVFEESGCTFQQDPRSEIEGPFCASDCNDR